MGGLMAEEIKEYSTSDRWNGRCISARHGGAMLHLSQEKNEIQRQ
jgi:hypothetical protein